MDICEATLFAKSVDDVRGAAYAHADRVLEKMHPSRTLWWKEVGAVWRRADAYAMKYGNPPALCENNSRLLRILQRVNDELFPMRQFEMADDLMDEALSIELKVARNIPPRCLMYLVPTPEWREEKQVVSKLRNFARNLPASDSGQPMLVRHGIVCPRGFVWLTLEEIQWLGL